MSYGCTDYIAIEVASASCFSILYYPHKSFIYLIYYKKGLDSTWLHHFNNSVYKTYIIMLVIHVNNRTTRHIIYILSICFKNCVHYLSINKLSRW